MHLFTASHASDQQDPESLFLAQTLHHAPQHLSFQDIMMYLRDSTSAIEKQKVASSFPRYQVIANTRHNKQAHPQSAQVPRPTRERLY